MHHVLKRAQGGSDFALDQLVALGRRCHERTYAPFIEGRLAWSLATRPPRAPGAIVPPRHRRGGRPRG
jgi:hypothetical protein